MRHRHIPILLAVALLALLTGAAATLAETFSPSAPVSIAPQGPSSPDYVGSGRRPGFYTINTRADIDLSDPKYGVVGDVGYFKWIQTNPAEDVYNFGDIDYFITTKAVGGRKVGLSFVTTTTRWETTPGVICAADAMPAWARKPHPGGSANINNYTIKVAGPKPLDPNRPGFRLDLPCEAPIYWSTLYQTYVRKWVHALAQHLFVERPDLGAKVEFIGIAHGVDGETRPVDNEDEPDLESLPGGFTSNIWVSAVNAITDIWWDEFRNQAGFTGPLFILGSPYYKSCTERPQFLGWAANRGVGIAILGLYPDSNGAVFGTIGSPPNCGAHDGIVNYGHRVPVAWETYQHMLRYNRDFYWATLHALGRHSDYIRIRRQFVYQDANGQPVPEIVSIIQQWQPYFGVTVDNTPSIWVAMREHRNPMEYGSQGFETNSNWPVLGNFEFYLRQVDSVPNGRTVIETNTSTVRGQPVSLGLCGPAPLGPPGYGCNSSPHNSQLPASQELKSVGGNVILSNYEAFYARRTDQATDNYMMWFDADSGYINPGGIPEGPREVRITVKYFDIGNDRWRLLYDSVSGPKYATLDSTGQTWVQKQGNRVLRTAIFTITDARLNGHLTGGMDFAIDSRNENGVKDGNEWIHMVDVVRISSSTPTPTPTYTPTEMPTETPTPTATPGLGRVHGMVFHDISGDGLRQEGEPGVADSVVSAFTFPGNTEVISQTTASDGLYEFSLPPGTYRITKTNPPGYTTNPDHDVPFVVPLSGGSDWEWNFPVIAFTPTPTPTATTTPTATPSPTPTRMHGYLPMVLRNAP